MQVTMYNKNARWIVLLIGIILMLISGIDLSKKVFSKTVDAEVVEVLDTWTQKRTGKHRHGYKYFTEYLVRYTNESGEKIEAPVIIIKYDTTQYSFGSVTKIDIQPDGTIVDHVYLPQKLAVGLLGLFGTFLCLVGIKAKVKTPDNS